MGYDPNLRENEIVSVWRERSSSAGLVGLLGVATSEDKRKEVGKREGGREWVIKIGGGG